VATKKAIAHQTFRPVKKAGGHKIIMEHDTFAPHYLVGRTDRLRTPSNSEATADTVAVL
jgi:hypothetical protein